MAPDRRHPVVLTCGLAACVLLSLVAAPVLALHADIAGQNGAAVCAMDCCQSSTTCCCGDEGALPNHERPAPCSGGKDTDCPCHRVNHGPPTLCAIVFDPIDLSTLPPVDAASCDAHEPSATGVAWAIDHPPQD